MSIIGQKFHTESIYDILYKEAYLRPKSPMYVSEREKDLKRLHSSIPKTHANMGYPDVPLKSSDEFLKKGEGIHVYSKKQKKKCLNDNKLPALPKENPKHDKKEKFNFEISNKKWVKEMPVGGVKESPVVVDSPDGHTSNVYKFRWVHTKSFGTIPKYLAQRNKMIEKEEEAYRKRLEDEEPLCKPISAEERDELLSGLKENWSRIQKEFLLLPVLIDTVPKVIRKTKLETQLKELERGIRMVEENPFIYIYG